MKKDNINIKLLLFEGLFFKFKYNKELNINSIALNFIENRLFLENLSYYNQIQFFLISLGYREFIIGLGKNIYDREISTVYFLI